MVRTELVALSSSLANTLIAQEKKKKKKKKSETEN